MVRFCSCSIVVIIHSLSFDRLAFSLASFTLLPTIGMNNNKDISTLTYSKKSLLKELIHRFETTSLTDQEFLLSIALILQSLLEKET